MIIEINENKQEKCKIAIKKLIDLNFLNNKYEIKHLKRSGMYLKLILNNKIQYIVFSNKTTKDGRNTYIIQPLITALKHYYFEKGNKEMFVLYLDDNPKISDYIIFSHKLIKNLNIDTLNDRKLKKYKKFNNIQEIQQFRWNTQKTQNFPTTIFLQNNQIQLFAKFNGTLINETILILIYLNTLHKEIFISQIYKNKEDVWEIKKIKNKIWFHNNFKYNEKFLKAKNIRGETYIDDEKKYDEKLRNKIFITNLYIKYGYKYCFFCDCKIDEIIDGAHIWDVSKIKKNKKLNFNEQREYINNVNNGIWLCKNHHKLFDKEMIKIDVLKKTLTESDVVKQWKGSNINIKIFKDYFNIYLSNKESIFYINQKYNKNNEL